jgi:hypothetical protein
MNWDEMDKVMVKLIITKTVNRAASWPMRIYMVIDVSCQPRAPSLRAIYKTDESHSMAMLNSAKRRTKLLSPRSPILTRQHVAQAFSGGVWLASYIRYTKMYPGRRSVYTWTDIR